MLYLAIAVAIAIVSVLMIMDFHSVLKFRTYVAGIPSQSFETGKPFVPISVIIPCKGDDGRLFGNLETLLDQDYPAAEFLLVTALAEDPAQRIFKQIGIAHPDVRIKTVVAGISPYGSEKCNNLLKAIAVSDPASEILVFLDADGRTNRNLIRKLVLGLENSSAAAVTGIRWYQPRWSSAPEVVRSVWNAAGYSLMIDKHMSYVWAGAMALRRKMFEEIGIADIWATSISDDITLGARLKELRLGTCFLPSCIVVSSEDDSWRSLFHWIARQIFMMRTYQKFFFWIMSFATVFGNVLGFGLLFWGLNHGSSSIGGLSILIGSLWIMHFWLDAMLMINPIQEMLKASGHVDLKFQRGMFLLLVPLAIFTHLCGSLRCLFAKRVRWAGVTYEVQGQISKRLPA